MAIFIKKENQQILWKTIQNIELFHQVLLEPQKPLWFKQIIGLFYEKYRDTRLSRLDLENLNRQVIEYMVNSLKQMMISPPTTAPIQNRKQVSFQEDTRGLLDFRPEFSSANLEKKAIQSQQYVSEFSARQQEYEQMMKRDTPPDVEFRKEPVDAAIKNMDELLEKQRKIRELDIATGIHPPPIQQPPHQRGSLVFMEETREPTIQVMNLETPTDPIQEIKDLLLELKQDFEQYRAGFSQTSQKRRIIRIQDDDDDDDDDIADTPPMVAEPKSIPSDENPVIETQKTWQ